MIFYENGQAQGPAILLIHGMGCNAGRSFAVPADLLGRVYHVITVDLDGYDGCGTTFTTIGDQADKLAAWLNSHCQGRLYACIGMSMGGFIAMDLACRHHIQISRLILDSGYVAPLPGLLAKTHFIEKKYPALKGAEGFQSFGFNAKSQIRDIVIFPLIAAVLAAVCVFVV